MTDAWMVRALAGALVVTSAAGCPASESEVTSQTSTSGSIDESTTSPESTSTSASTTTSSSTSTSATSGNPTASSGATTLPPPPSCGDGVIDPDEECDLGELNADTAACTSTCRVAVCGDGLVHAGVELCDDANEDPSDGCDLCGIDLDVPPRPRLVAGYSHTCALSMEGAVRCWGASDPMVGHGQLGTGDLGGVGDEPGEMPPADVMVGGAVAQLSAGSWHTCAVLEGGEIRCWGKGDNGQLGTGAADSLGDGPGEMPPPAIDLGGDALQVSAGGGWEGHTCALLVGGEVRCWGNNEHGQLGVTSEDLQVGDEPGEMPPKAVPLPRPAVQVTTSQRSSCALLEDGGVVCWGSFMSKSPPTPVAIGGAVRELAANGDSFCALLVSGAVRCWGANLWGNLGLGHDQAVASPALAGDLELGGSAVRIVLGATHTCALLEGGVLRCFGDNAGGQLGVGHTDNLGDQPGEMPTPAIDLPSAVVEVAAGGQRTCAKTESDDYFCWGGNLGGDLGLGHKTPIGDDPGEMPPPPVPVF